MRVVNTLFFLSVFIYIGAIFHTLHYSTTPNGGCVMEKNKNKFAENLY